MRRVHVQRNVYGYLPNAIVQWIRECNNYDGTVNGPTSSAGVGVFELYDLIASFWSRVRSPPDTQDGSLALEDSDTPLTQVRMGGGGGQVELFSPKND